MVAERVEDAGNNIFKNYFIHQLKNKANDFECFPWLLMSQQLLTITVF